jgi:hypothetical protein
MRIFGRRLITAAVISGVLGAATVATTVPAAAATKYTCTLQGTTTSLNPPIPAPPKTGGTGNFSFNGSAKCVQGIKLTTYAISSSGSYKSIVCGTGSASGTATFSGGPSPINYNITFVGGQGTLKVTGGGTGNGAVSIRPQNTGGCVNKPVTGFIVTGATSITQ